MTSIVFRLLYLTIFSCMIYIWTSLFMNFYLYKYRILKSKKASYSLKSKIKIWSLILLTCVIVFDQFILFFLGGVRLYLKTVYDNSINFVTGTFYVELFIVNPIIELFEVVGFLYLILH